MYIQSNRTGQILHLFDYISGMIELSYNSSCSSILVANDFVSYSDRRSPVSKLLLLSSVLGKYRPFVIQLT